jgi:hypothetical protein
VAFRCNPSNERAGLFKADGTYMTRKNSKFSFVRESVQYVPYVALGVGLIFIILLISSYIRPWSRDYSSFSIGSENGALIASGPNGDLFWLIMIPYWVLVLISVVVVVGGYALQARARRRGLQGARGFPVE